VAEPDVDQRPIRLSVLLVSLIGVLVAVAIAFVVRNVFVAARTPIAWTIAAVILAVLLLPLVEALGRRIPRVVAAALVLLVLAGAYFLVGFRFVDDLSTGVDRLREELPTAAQELEQQSGLLRDFELSQRVTEWADQLPDQSIRPTTAATTVVNFLVAGTLTLFLMLYGPRMADAAIGQVRDERRRRELDRFAAVAITRTWRYVAGSLLGMAVFGVMTYVICRIVDLPTPTPLAVVVALLSALPYFGVVLGSLPVLILAGGLNSPREAVVLAVVFAAMQFGQVRLWRRVHRRSLYVGPALLAVIGLIGFDLYGLGGLLFGSVIGVFLVSVGDAAANANFRTGSPGPAARSDAPAAATTAEPSG
jgi:predicted PurR-regulated permease PerM